MAEPKRSIFDERRDQTFPKLDPSEIERVRRFGDVRSYAAGEPLMIAGQVAPGLVVVLTGCVVVTAFSAHAVQDSNRRTRLTWLRGKDSNYD